MRPTLIITQTHIGYGSPNREDTSKAHGEPLGHGGDRSSPSDAYGWPKHRAVLRARRRRSSTGARRRSAGENLQAEWMRRFADYAKNFPSEAKEIGRRWHGDLPAGWEKTICPRSTRPTATSPAARPQARCSTPSRRAVPELVGGSADLAGSNLTTIKGDAELQSGAARRPQHPLRHPRARDGRHHERHGAARRDHPVRRHLPRLHRLHAARHPARRAHEAARASTSSRTTPSGSARTAPRTSRSSSSPRCGASRTWSCSARPTRTRPPRRGAWRIKHRTGPVALVLTRQKLPLIDRTV